MKRRILLTFLLLFFCFEKSFAQVEPKAEFVYNVKEIEPEGCEFNDLHLEYAHRQSVENSQRFGISQTLILIARPGIKDRKKGLGVLIERRLYTARAYLTDYLKKRTKETVITAIAPNNGVEYGVIEIYVSGVLYDVLVSHPNYGISVGSCESLESDDAESRARRALLYPWLYSSKSQKNRKK